MQEDLIGKKEQSPRPNGVGVGNGAEPWGWVGVEGGYRLLLSFKNQSSFWPNPQKNFSFFIRKQTDKTILMKIGQK